MSFFESGDQRICGRRGCGRCSSLGRGSVSPYDQYSTPSVVSWVESPPPRGRMNTLYFETNASHFLSGDSTTRSRSEEHTSEFQSRRELACRLLLEKKKYDTRHNYIYYHIPYT